MVAADDTVLTRGSRPFLVTHFHLTEEVMLPGFYPEGDGESIHEDTDFDVVEAALWALRRRSSDLPDLERTIRHAPRLAGFALGITVRGRPNHIGKLIRHPKTGAYISGKIARSIRPSRWRGGEGRRQG
ncbi:hypothetical protein [Prosthecodimorpha staleyi]|uniref:Uncharacterized protein n=1 Tax=Prosthecodimorpha staleyi TaxID=2840188 RepID=A0A947D8A7_9HYPH|nr:hypothetical protein [Prosthecodimorpha staleyi]MBT9290052.1 hypothetical protein [Prosthecodimorpha staleyi]